MAKEKIGDACAYIPSTTKGAKGTYLRLGSALRDSAYGTISIKIDTLPVPGNGWTGWINIFEREQEVAATPVVKARPAYIPDTDFEDDIPF